MTVTLSTDELHEYENRLRKWALGFAMALTVTRTEFNHHLGNICGISGSAHKSSVKEWMKENPIPRLIPAVLEEQSNDA